MPTLSTVNDELLSLGLEKQSSDDCFLKSKKAEEPTSNNNDGKIFNFISLNQQPARPQVGKEQSADLFDPIPCSSSSTTSSSESPSSVSVPGDKVDIYCKIAATETSPTHDNDPHLAIDSNGSNKQKQDAEEDEDEKVINCYNSVLDDEIRARLDKLNALSDLINSLELQFDQANCLFREILKCSTYRLSIIAKKLGSKSLNYGRNYHAARITVEQSQSDCQKACVQFEQANNDHQFAREAIREAESKLRQIASSTSATTTCKAATRILDSSPSSIVSHSSQISFEQIDLSRLKLGDDATKTKSSSDPEYSPTEYENDSDKTFKTQKAEEQRSDFALGVIDSPQANCFDINSSQSPSISSQECLSSLASNDTKLQDAAELSDTLNVAVKQLREAEQKRRQSEKMHLDQANKLMIAQENLQRLEREHGNSIRRSQLYFDEANRFKARLNSIKSDIRRISDDILAAKQAYARTLSELEQFSEDLHVLSANANKEKNGTITSTASTTDQKS